MWNPPRPQLDVLTCDILTRKTVFSQALPFSRSAVFRLFADSLLARFLARLHWPTALRRLTFQQPIETTVEENVVIWRLRMTLQTMGGLTKDNAVTVMTARKDRPVMEQQIDYRKSRLVLSARFRVLTWLCLVFGVSANSHHFASHHDENMCMVALLLTCKRSWIQLL